MKLSMIISRSANLSVFYFDILSLGLDFKSKGLSGSLGTLGPSLASMLLISSPSLFILNTCN